MSGEKQIIKAISDCIGTMGKLSKASKNQYDNYNFTSIDDFLSATGKACSDHGLVVIQDEVSCETIQKQTKTGSSGWLKLSFAYQVHHTGGEVIEFKPRTVAVPFNGAQAFGSAQSFGLKQFLRMLFQISTGDQDDPDYQPSQPETPTIEQPPAPISDKTIETLLGIAESINAFPSQDIFREWIEVTCKSNLGGLSEKSGQKIIRFLTESPNVSQWGEQYVIALTTAMKNQGVEDEPG